MPTYTAITYRSVGTPGSKNFFFFQSKKRAKNQRRNYGTISFTMIVMAFFFFKIVNKHSRKVISSFGPPESAISEISAFNEIIIPALEWSINSSQALLNEPLSLTANDSLSCSMHAARIRLVFGNFREMRVSVYLFGFLLFLSLEHFSIKCTHITLPMS